MATKPTVLSEKRAGTRFDELLEYDAEFPAEKTVSPSHLSKRKSKSRDGLGRAEAV